MKDKWALSSRMFWDQEILNNPFYNPKVEGVSATIDTLVTLPAEDFFYLMEQWEKRVTERYDGHYFYEECHGWCYVKNRHINGRWMMDELARNTERDSCRHCRKVIRKINHIAPTKAKYHFNARYSNETKVAVPLYSAMDMFKGLKKLRVANWVQYGDNCVRLIQSGFKERNISEIGVIMEFDTIPRREEYDTRKRNNGIALDICSDNEESDDEDYTEHDAIVDFGFRDDEDIVPNYREYDRTEEEVGVTTCEIYGTFDDRPTNTESTENPEELYLNTGYQRGGCINLQPHPHRIGRIFKRYKVGGYWRATNMIREMRVWIRTMCVIKRNWKNWEQLNCEQKAEMATCELYPCANCNRDNYSKNNGSESDPHHNNRCMYSTFVRQDFAKAGHVKCTCIDFIDATEQKWHEEHYEVYKRALEKAWDELTGIEDYRKLTNYNEWVTDIRDRMDRMNTHWNKEGGFSGWSV